MNESAAAYDLRFTLIDVRGQKCLFSESRVLTDSIPLPFIKYEVRYADESDGAYISGRVNDCFLGTVIAQSPLEFNKENALSLDEGEIDFYTGSEMSLAAFADARGIETKPRSGRSTRSIGLVEFADEFVGDARP